MVSVIIPTHNNNTLSEAVSSVLYQTYSDFEVIIINNGSSYRVEAKEYPFNDNRVRIINTVESLGAAGARNYGIDLAKGEYVAFLDADDYWANDKLAKQMKVLEDFEEDGKRPDICFTGRQIVDESSRVTRRYIGCHKIVRYDDLLRTNQINCSSVIMRTSDAKKYRFPISDKKTGEFHEDYILWLTILKNGGYAAGINKPLLYYRKTSNSKSGNKLKSAIMNYRVYKYMGLRWGLRIKYMLTYTFYGIKKHGGIHG